VTSPSPPPVATLRRASIRARSSSRRSGSSTWRGAGQSHEIPFANYAKTIDFPERAHAADYPFMISESTPQGPVFIVILAGPLAG